MVKPSGIGKNVPLAKPAGKLRYAPWDISTQPVRFNSSLGEDHKPDRTWYRCNSSSDGKRDNIKIYARLETPMDLYPRLYTIEDLCSAHLLALENEPSRELYFNLGTEELFGSPGYRYSKKVSGKDFKCRTDRRPETLRFLQAMQQKQKRTRLADEFQSLKNSWDCLAVHNKFPDGYPK